MFNLKKYLGEVFEYQEILIHKLKVCMDSDIRYWLILKINAE